MIPYIYQVPAHDLLFPTPKSIEEKEGLLKLHLGSAYAIDEKFKTLSPLLESQLGLNEGCEDVLLTVSSVPLPTEAYTLSVNKEQVVAKASDIHGMFNAIQTLRQLYLANDGLIPCCRIEDEPAFPWRGFMLDCSRHFFQVEEIEKLIDVAAMHHLNVFHWHLTDDQGWRFPVDGYPKLETIAGKRIDHSYADGRTYDGFYSKDDIRKIVRFATERMVTVVPEVECPGHASALLAAYPELGCTGGPYHVRDEWGVFPEVMCPGEDKAFTFMETALDSICQLFPGPYVHIGGDECPHLSWKTCPKCRKRMKDEHIANEDELQGWFTAKIAKMVHDRGKQCIGWDEVWEFADKDKLPEDLIIMSWRGAEGGISAARQGHRVIMCPNTEGVYLDYRHTDDPNEMGNIGVSTISQLACFNPCKDEIDSALVLGAQGNLWTEKVSFGREAEYMLYPRLAVLAERLWQPQKPEGLIDKLSWEYKKLDKLDVLCYRGPME
jgi:hexosaminidase